MNVYLVGGAIRDQLLGLPVKEQDWVVTGSTPEAMLAAGYQPVGKDFPVFLHPETHEEYALARTERKQGLGYHGFVFHADSRVSLDEDLARRDLTINAMARDSAGRLFDPYGGQADLQQGILRHVSPAFAEDPVRLLRLARFAAKLPTFMVAQETMDYCCQLVQAGEVAALVAERVWQEWAKAMVMPAPWRFFEVLSDCGAMSVLFPELMDLAVGHHLARVADACASLDVRLAVGLHCLPVEQLSALLRRYRVPKQQAQLSLLVAKTWRAYRQACSADAVVTLLQQVDVVRRPERFEQWLQACQYCHSDISVVCRVQTWRRCAEVMAGVDTQALLAEGFSGLAFAQALRSRQVEEVAHVLGD